LKYFLAAILLLCAAPAPSFSENKIGLYADIAASGCEIADNTPGYQLIYVFLTGTAPATGVVFSAPIPPCWQGATFLGNGWPGYRGADGNTQDSFFITLYPPGNLACPTPPVLICTIIVGTTGQSLPCCEMRVKATADNPNFTYFDCTAIVQHPFSSGQKIVVNPNASCPCMLPVTTQPSTWGRVKSLYR